MQDNYNDLRGLLVEIFINNEPNDLVSKLSEYNDTQIILAYTTQNRILTESISSSVENNEARLSHLEFYYRFNKWFLEFQETHKLTFGGKVLDKENLHKISTYYGFRFIYEELDGECLDENSNQLVICCMPDDSGCWVEDHSGEEVFRSSAQGVYLTDSGYERYKVYKYGS